MTTTTPRTGRYPAAGKPKDQLQNQYTLMALAGVELEDIVWNLKDTYPSLETSTAEIACIKPNDSTSKRILLWDPSRPVFTDTGMEVIVYDSNETDLMCIAEQLVAMHMLDYDEEVP